MMPYFKKTKGSQQNIDMSNFTIYNFYFLNFITKLARKQKYHTPNLTRPKVYTIQ